MKSILTIAALVAASVLIILIVFGSVGFVKKITDPIVRSMSKEKESCTTQIFKGNHTLRKFNTSIQQAKSTSAGFFFFFGSYDSKESNNKIVTFAWKGNDDIYTISSLPINRIRVKIDDSVDTPYVKFRWTSQVYGCDNIENLVDRFVYYAVVCCKSSDWTLDINLNEEKPNEPAKLQTRY